MLGYLFAGLALFFAATMSPGTLLGGEGPVDQCVEYDLDKSYVDEYGVMVLRFQSSCDESRRVQVCITNAEGENRQHSLEVPKGESADLNVGRNIPDQTFYWTQDGSDPCEEEE